jgi:hypothetical protein
MTNVVNVQLEFAVVVVSQRRREDGVSVAPAPAESFNNGDNV